MNSSIAEILDRAADLIEPEGTWTQEAYARDESGDALGDGRHISARCWCLVGALEKASGALVSKSLSAPIREVLNVIASDSIVKWNDAPERTQPEVVSILREAAAKAREASS